MTDARKADLGRRVVEERRRHEETQKDLAQAIKTTVQTINGWESGRRAPSPDLMRRLAAHYNLTPDDLWPGWDENAVPRGGNRKSGPTNSQLLDRLLADFEAAERRLTEQGVEIARQSERIAVLEAAMMAEAARTGAATAALGEDEASRQRGDTDAPSSTSRPAPAA
ncbi:MAG: helix-turn-helix transcriptional regulator [Solirubrobacteraceae bacterium]|nr:helix-turn-helix transcriptional regulator [Solirubrobacteraceae bacterium]